MLVVVVTPHFSVPSLASWCVPAWSGHRNLPLSSSSFQRAATRRKRRTGRSLSSCVFRRSLRVTAHRPPSRRQKSARNTPRTGTKPSATRRGWQGLLAPQVSADFVEKSLRSRSTKFRPLCALTPAPAPAPKGPRAPSPLRARGPLAQAVTALDFQPGGPGIESHRAPPSHLPPIPLVAPYTAALPPPRLSPGFPL